MHVVQAREYLGPEDPTQESLQYVLVSTAAAGSRAHGLPYLPTGNLVSGLPAALMSCCQARQPLSHINTVAGSCLWQCAVAIGQHVSQPSSSRKMSAMPLVWSNVNNGMQRQLRARNPAKITASFIFAGAAEGCHAAAVG